MNRFALAVLVTILAPFTLSACAAKPAKKTPPPAAPTYAERVLERVKSASEREVHDLRYNPTVCGCPPFEVQLDGRWLRSTFDVADDSHPVLMALREAVEADEAAGRLGTYVVQGRLLDRVTTCGQGAIFVTLDPSAYGAPPPPPEDGEEEPEDEDEDGEETPEPEASPSSSS